MSGNQFMIVSWKWPLISTGSHLPEQAECYHMGRAAVKHKTLNSAAEMSQIPVSPWKAVLTTSSHHTEWRLPIFHRLKSKDSAILVFPCLINQGSLHTPLIFHYPFPVTLKPSISKPSSDSALPKLLCASQIHFQYMSENWWRVFCPNNSFSKGSLCP